MDDDRWQELSSRLDHIEQYLVELGQMSGYQYTPAAGFSGQAPLGQAPFGQAPVAQGPVGQWAGGPGGQPPVPADLVAMAQSGNAIQAVKLYREMTGVSLKEAKRAVDQASGRYWRR